MFLSILFFVFLRIAQILISFFVQNDKNLCLTYFGHTKNSLMKAFILFLHQRVLSYNRISQYSFSKTSTTYNVFINSVRKCFATPTADASFL